jgi:hypothetical protein
MQPHREKSAAEILSNLKGITLSSQFHETVAQLYLGRWTGEPGRQARVYDLPGKRPTGLWNCGFQEVASGTLVLASTARDISTFRPGDSVTVSGRISDVSRLYVRLEDANRILEARILTSSDALARAEQCATGRKPMNLLAQPSFSSATIDTSANRVHRMDAGWSPEAFEVCRV